MNKKILITGAGGSIGSGLVKKLIQHNYHNLVLLDNSEYLLFTIVHQLNYRYKSYLADIRDKERIKEILEKEKPDIIFHTAALKHVPLLEENPQEAIKTNVLGTLNLVQLAKEYSIKKFIFISSDKAIKPTSIMGASKRIGEMICQYYKKHTNSIFVSVRFGNVLGSSGSVIPIFKEQIERGGPVTVTDPNMKRFFMSIDQACELLISTMEIAQQEDDIFFLNMGEPINIYELAKYMILSYGKMPEKDIEIKITGLRPGEKLYEEIYDKKDESIKPTTIEGIQKVVLNGVPENLFDILNQLFYAKDTESIKKYIKQLIPDFPINNYKKN
jgi:FlaA1/EpsC-like NDP-sugar epimerase